MKATDQQVARLLQQHPWQEYGYRLGRWERVERASTYFTNETKWGRAYDTLQLLDPVTGRPVAEVWADPQIELPAPGGRVLVAGDPRTVVGYTPVGDGRPDVHLAVSVALPVSADVEQLLALAPGSVPPDCAAPYQEQFPYGRPAWIGDQPGRPRRKQGFSWDKITLPSQVPAGTRSMLGWSWRWHRTKVVTRKSVTGPGHD